jgi:hypothetical protein
MYVHCDTDKDCGMTGELVCSAQRCVFKGGGVVVNADASTSDGTMQDVGPATDASTDATATDSSSDAGLDAAPLDTGTVQGDAGNMDALPVDGSTSDFNVTIGTRSEGLTEVHPSGLSGNSTKIEGASMGTGDDLVLTIGGNLPGTYNCGTVNVTVTLTNPMTMENYTAPSGTCTINITRYDPAPIPGGTIQGNFTSTLTRVTGMGPATMSVNGSFTITRDM